VAPQSWSGESWLAKPVVRPGGLVEQPLQRIASILSQGRTHVLAEERETMSQQQPGPGQCRVSSVAFL